MKETFEKNPSRWFCKQIPLELQYIKESFYKKYKSNLKNETEKKKYITWNERKVVRILQTSTSKTKVSFSNNFFLSAKLNQVPKNRAGHATTF